MHCIIYSYKIFVISSTTFLEKFLLEALFIIFVLWIDDSFFYLKQNIRHIVHRCIMVITGVECIWIKSFIFCKENLFPLPLYVSSFKRRHIYSSFTVLSMSVYVKTSLDEILMVFIKHLVC